MNPIPVPVFSFGRSPLPNVPMTIGSCSDRPDSVQLVSASLHASPRFDSAVSLTQPPADWTGLKGRITQHVLTAAEKLRDPVHYLVGHGDMIRDVKQALEARGVDRKKRIRTEIFYPASKPAK